MWWKGGTPLKKYSSNENKEIEEVVCNCCGKTIKTEHGIVKEGIFMAEIKWGYFSEKDGEIHSFDMCEACYDKMTESFQVPIERKPVREFL